VLLKSNYILHSYDRSELTLQLKLLKMIYVNSAQQKTLLSKQI